MVVLVVENDSNEIQAISGFLKERGHLCIATDSVKSARALAKRENPALILLGLNGSGQQPLDFLESAQGLDPPVPVIVLTRKAKLEDAVAAVKRGAYDCWTKPVSAERLSSVLDSLAGSPEGAPAAAGNGAASGHAIITDDAAMFRIKTFAKRVASSNATVFIQGESGTGKELFARFIHQNSPRNEKPFIGLNCAALPDTLLESELFGYEKGAFTGAIKTRVGKFELAHSGTLLLDEVTEIPLHLQSKLLRVLQESEVDRLGGKYPVRVDVRVIATTNISIEEQVRLGRFRKDLYYRLNVIPLKIPPLRDRPLDVALLAVHFHAQYSAQFGTGAGELAPEAMKKLQAHSWPGNVRELQNVMQRAVLMSGDPQLGPGHILFDSEETDPVESPAAIALMPLWEMEKMMIQKALSTFEGNRTRAAEMLGISVRTLRNKLNEYRQSLEG